MPELPEVETTRKGILPFIDQKRITSVALYRNAIRHPIPPQFGETCEGSRVISVQRRAKYILLGLDVGQTILIHLGMSGVLRMHKNQPEIVKHDHALFAFENGSHMVFHDPRRFGMLDLLPTDRLYEDTRLAGLGPEPLEAGFDAEYLHQAFAGKKQAIKQAIMDQRIVVGVGNIYAAESLFLSGIHPETKAGSVSKKKLAVLVHYIKEVLNAALASGGSTLRDYVRSSGDSGYFQHHFQVYGRENEPCLACATPITRITQAGRSTFYCGVCQKK